MQGPPHMMFVVDLNKEHIAVAEARRLGIPVVGIADTNVDPELIDFPIPGNDDAIRSIKLFANLVADAYLEGAQIYEQKLRTQTDKASDLEKEKMAGAEEAAPETRRRGRAPGAAAAQADKKPAGPAVVKAAKTRKLVAAGMADEVEIAQELEEGSQAKSEEGEE